MRLGTGELLLILLIVMLVFGASRVSELGKGLGQGMKSFRDALKSEDDKPHKDHEPPSAGARGKGDGSASV